MDGEAIRRITDLALQAEAREIDGHLYTLGSYKPVGVVHEETVRFTTLSDFCRFIQDNPQKQDFSNAIIVISPDLTVSLLGAPNPLDGERTRLAYAKKHDTEGFFFNHIMDAESFVVALKSKFERSDSDWEEVFNLVRKVQIEDKVELNDDGMSQKVTVKKGISAASIETTSKPTDYALRPYRIFPEVLQPKSYFFLRLSGSKEIGVKVGLFETDGGAWQIEAAKAVKDFIACHIGDKADSVPVYC